MTRGIAAAALAAALMAAAPAAQAAEAPVPPDRDWSFEGFFGTYDLASAQRGLQVYLQVCSSCHSMDLVAYRSLTDIGFSDAQVEAIAAQYTVTDGPDDSGEMYTRPAEPPDQFAAPYPNEQAARAANGGALPPDLSVIAQGRPNGPDYIYALLTGYEEAPPDETVPPGQYWNEYFAGHLISMPNMLATSAVEYADGTEATLEQQAWDVTNFLMWAAEPHLEERKQMGVKVMLFLIVFTGLMYAVKRQVWADVH
jgi:ubiquinol-cytochrome c reductase cytochrome c1 subunit